MILSRSSCLLLAVKVSLFLYTSVAYSTAFYEEASSLSKGELVRLGLQHEHGESADKNIDKAIKYYCLAARKDSPVAHYHLGWIYANGRGVLRDDVLAGQWFSKGARLGDKDAKKMLRFVSTSAGSEKEGKCILSDGSEFLEPIKSVPDPSPELIQKWVERLSPDYGLDPRLVLAVIKAESNFNVKARSPKNAQGLMQLIPATAKRFNVTDVWDPLDNIKGGMAYLKWLMAHFKGEIDFVLAGYNAGEKAVERFKGIPPYNETRAYVRYIKRTLKNQKEILPETI